MGRRSERGGTLEVVEPVRNVRRRSASRVGIVVFVGVAVARLAIVGLSFPAVRRLVHVGSQLPSCSEAHISNGPAREGTCARGSEIFGAAEVFVVVDRAHTIRMPGYTAHLVATSFSVTTVSGPRVSEAEYPGRRAVRLSFELAVRNETATPLRLDPDAERVDLLTPASPDSDRDESWGELRYGNGGGAPTPLLSQLAPIPAHATGTGWATFVVPVRTRELVTARTADLELYPPGRTEHDHYTGQIRLWQ